MGATRLAHHAVLAATLAAVCLPHLGTPSLWDVDEGVNAGCTREMMEAGTWIVPTFNWELRTAKPVMLYWLQRLSFNLFGVSELAARLPAVACSLGTVLLVYELARRMFGAGTGLLAGLILASSVEFVKLAHAATPDAPLLLFTTLTFVAVWFGHANGGRGWFVPAAAASGLAVLTKGPVGVALPGLAVFLYLAWNRELRRLWDHLLIRGILVLLLVAGPWYGLVIAETRGAYLEFFRTENANRFLNPMEGHRGPPVYYLGAILAFFAPWSAFVGAVLWYGVKGCQSPGSADPVLCRPNRFLLCWFVSYLVFFSAAATKLPNYIGPLYPALAILTARFLMLWRDELIQPRRWVMPLAVAGFALAGVVVAAGLLVAGGAIPVPVKGLRVLPGLESYAWVGLFPLTGAGVMGFALRAGNRPLFVHAATAAAVGFVGVTAAFPPGVVDRYKAPKQLVEQSGAADDTREVRLASLDYTQPSVTFYAGRRVDRLFNAADAREFLAQPRPAFLFVPEPAWTAQLAGTVPTPHRIAARRFDLYRNCDVLVVTNEDAR